MTSERAADYIKWTCPLSRVLRREAEKWGRRRTPGIAHSRAVFV